MATSIIDSLTTTNEIVLSERVTTSDFKITEINESIRQRRVEVQIELGPFTTETRPNGETETRGSRTRGVMVWQGAEYDAIRDTWRNEDLIEAVKAKL